ELAEVRHLDYRDVPAERFDASSSIGLTEPIGKKHLPDYFRFLYERLVPGGRLLNHCITRPDNHEPAARRRHFINRYIFPDGELESVGHLISVMHDTGFEVRHEENLREHYARTLAAWSANLEAHWDEAVAEVGLARARTWRLYLVGSRIGFERNQIQLHQVLGSDPDDQGRSPAPLRRAWAPPLPCPAPGRTPGDRHTPPRGMSGGPAGNDPGMTDASAGPVRPVVVGVDGSQDSLVAADLAADEAELRHRPLEIVHAFV